MHKSKSSDFRVAIEESFLAEHGFFDTSRGTVQLSRTKVNPVGVEKATGSKFKPGSGIPVSEPGKFPQSFPVIICLCPSI